MTPFLHYGSRSATITGSQVRDNFVLFLNSDAMHVFVDGLLHGPMSKLTTSGYPVTIRVLHLGLTGKLIINEMLNRNHVRFTSMFFAGITDLQNKKESEREVIITF